MDIIDVEARSLREGDADANYGITHFAALIEGEMSDLHDLIDLPLQ
jgi:hypothetical protein